MSEPTNAELMLVVDALRTEVATLRAENERLRARVAHLEDRLRSNSRNSAKPPSSDGLGKPAPKSLRRKSGRKPGGQDGHPGKTLYRKPDPDTVVRNEPSGPCECGLAAGAGEEIAVERRQVWDLPPQDIETTEYQLITRRCACGTNNKGTAPAGVDAPVQYGPRIQAIIVYLYVGQFLSKKRTAQALADLFGIPLSDGTVGGVTSRTALNLDLFRELTREQLIASPVVHFDETGLRVATKLHWLHSASNATLTLLHVHPRRGRAAIKDHGILPGYTGTAVHDAWAPYDTYTQALHALCNAHLLRELQAVIDLNTTGNWCWAQQISDHLLAIQKHIEDNPDSKPDAAIINKHSRYISDAATIAARDTTHSGPLGSKHRALARRVRDRLDDYLRFTTDPAVPFTNNQAEQDIRMVKIRQKVSGCLRTLTGAEQFAAIRSYTSTSQKQGQDLYAALIQLTSGTPWLPNGAQPC